MLASLMLLAAAAAQPTPPALPVHVEGRAIRETDGSLSFGWPGVAFEIRFRGTGVRLRLDAPGDFLRLLVDGEEKLILKRPGEADILLGGLPDGAHVVRLEKMTESQQGGSRFLGFLPTPGDTPLPAPARARQIEFVGDSYTVGYGNTSPTRTCTPREIHDRTDTQQAFGPLVARRYDADYRIIAYSGFGIVRNYGGHSPETNLPSLYDRLQPDDPSHLESAAGDWHPQIIVVNLGTNDFSTPLKPGEKWRDADALRADYRRSYIAFVQRLEARQPQARFILMASDAFLPDVEQIAAALEAERPGRITVLKFGDLELTGCDWHPSLADDRQLAASIESTIDRLGLGWTAEGDEVPAPQP